MAKETATPAPAETKAEKKPEKKAPAESVYTVSELAGNARSVCILRRCGGIRTWKNTRTYREA